MCLVTKRVPKCYEVFYFKIVGVICKTPQETCPESDWQCDTGKECLPLEFVCDGVFDCEDQSDEGAQHCDVSVIYNNYV